MILQPTEIKKATEALHKQNKSIVLVGGCFDILHAGHVKFLEAAKQQGDILVVLLESDESVGKLKGPNRPFNTQMDRATVISSLKSVDLTILLHPFCKDEDYRDIIGTIQPRVIATTSGDPKRFYKERHAETVGAQVVDVIKRIPDLSSTELSKNFKL